MSIEERALRKVSLRLLPFLSILFFLDVLDRSNVGYAKLTMNQALGFNDAIFAFGAGIYFIGYLIFEVPSNLALERFGARRWMARIAITWGLISASMAFMSTATSFYLFRFTLGLAEAGFLPGVILYLTYWYPMSHRARAVSRFTALSFILGAIGNPISSQLLEVGSLFGLASWQWLFILEGLPAVALGFVCLAVLNDRPSQARWLTPEERDRLTTIIASEQEQRERVRSYTLAQALRSPQVLALAAVFFGDLLASNGVTFWLPTLIKGFGVATAHTGWVALIPHSCSVAFMIFWGWHSDRSGERIWHLFTAAMMFCIGLVAFGQLSSPVLQIAALCLALMGHNGLLGVFWTLPTSFLSRSAAAGGIALINALGNSAGFFGPQIVNYLKGPTNNFGLAFATLACAPLASGLLVLAIGYYRATSQPGGAAALDQSR